MTRIDCDFPTKSSQVASDQSDEVLACSTETVSVISTTDQSSTSSSSITADELLLPLSECELEKIETSGAGLKCGFYALANAIYQFSEEDRLDRYFLLNLKEWQIQGIEKNHKEKSIKAYEKKLGDWIFYEMLDLGENANISYETLAKIAERLEINLIILRGKEKATYHNFYGNEQISGEIHECFRDRLCVEVGKKIDLFFADPKHSFYFFLQKQGIAAEIYQRLSDEFHKITQEVLRREKGEGVSKESPYDFFYDSHEEQIRSDPYQVYSKIGESLEKLQNFVRDYFLHTLSQKPLAIIWNETGDASCGHYETVNLIQLKEYSESLAFCRLLNERCQTAAAKLKEKKDVEEAVREILSENHLPIGTIAQRNTLFKEHFESFFEEEEMAKLKELSRDLVKRLKEKEKKDHFSEILAFFSETETPIDCLEKHREILKKKAVFFFACGRAKLLYEKYSKHLNDQKLLELYNELDKGDVQNCVKNLYEAIYSEPVVKAEELAAEIEPFLKQKDSSFKALPGPSLLSQDDEQKYPCLATFLSSDLTVALKAKSVENKFESEGDKPLPLLLEELEKINSEKLEKGQIEKLGEAISDIRRRVELLKSMSDVKNFTPSKKIYPKNDFPVEVLSEICLLVEREFGQVPRDTQLLALLSLIQNDQLKLSDLKGTLAEVKTGEGKSLMALMLAIVKVKQGETVDIITSSKTLAIRETDRFKNFYKLFDIDVDCNCNEKAVKSPDHLPKDCYKNKQVVYGDAASFSGDTLRDEFYRFNTFSQRKATTAIVDEADSILLDRPGWLCQISDSVSGMSTVTPLLYVVWAKMNQELGQLVQKNEGKNPFQSKENIQEFFKSVENSIKGDIGCFFANENETNSLEKEKSYFIPDHLKATVEQRIPYWVESAFTALCIYSQDKEYDADKESEKITPIDYANTGEWEGDVQWENGLHQFLQICNNFPVQTESFTKSFMSNYTLLRRYESIYGMSGTLGGPKENEVLKDLFSVQSIVIPPFRASKFQQKDIYVANGRDSDEVQSNWLNFIYQDILNDGQDIDFTKIDKEGFEDKRHKEIKRCSLVVCKTIQDVKSIEKYLEEQGIPKEQIVRYIKGDDDKAKLEKATRGKIIVATNLSGRGTDIEASDIEAVGGMHVIVSYLPSNMRVELQAFGRTARKGLSGTGRLIIKGTELDEEHQTKDTGEITYKSVIDGRNHVENERLQTLVKTEKKDFQSKETLFKEFQEHYHSLDQNMRFREDFGSAKKAFLSLYNDYTLDQWALFIDQVNKKLKTSEIEDFKLEVGEHLDVIRRENLLFNVRYANILLDLKTFGASKKTFHAGLEEAGKIYSQSAKRKDLTAGFSCYNQVFVVLAKNPGARAKAKKFLEEAQTIFKMCEKKEQAVLLMQKQQSEEEAKKNDQKAESSMMKIIKTMLYSVKDQLKTLKKLSKDYDEFNVGFNSPYDLMEKDIPQSEKSKKDKKEMKGATIPQDILEECIKLGLKGPLQITGKGNTLLAIIMAIVCVALAIAAIAAIVFTGGTAAPLVLFLAGVVFSAAVGGAINSIKGAVNGDFSMKKFGKEVAIGAAAGIAGGAIAAPLGAAAGQIANVGLRILAQTGIGALSGAVGSAASYATQKGLYGEKFCFKEMGISMGKGALGGALGGGIGGAFGGQNASIGRVALGGALGSATADAAIQGIEIAQGKRKHFDGWELLEATAKGGLTSLIMAKAQKLQQARQAAKLEQQRQELVEPEKQQQIQTKGKDSLGEYEKILSSEKLADKAFMEKLAKFNQEKPIVSADELRKQNFGEGPKVSEHVDPIRPPGSGKLAPGHAQDIRDNVPSVSDAGILPEDFENKAFVRRPGEQRNNEHAGAFRRGRAASIGGQYENPQAQIHQKGRAMDNMPPSEQEPTAPKPSSLEAAFSPEAARERRERLEKSRADREARAAAKAAARAAAPRAPEEPPQLNQAPKTQADAAKQGAAYKSLIGSGSIDLEFGPSATRTPEMTDHGSRPLSTQPAEAFIRSGGGRWFVSSWAAEKITIGITGTGGFNILGNYNPTTNVFRIFHIAGNPPNER